MGNQDGELTPRKEARLLAAEGDKSGFRQNTQVLILGERLYEDLEIDLRESGEKGYEGIDGHVLGELEVPGMAHYIEVWGDRLITIGQTDAGCGKVLLTLFNISHLNNPQLIDQMTLEANDRSEALWDHRAHTFHPDFELLALSLSVSGAAPEMGFFHVDPDNGFTNLGGLNHSQLLDSEERYVKMRRSLRVVNHHYSVSEAGISVSSFFDLTDPVSEVAYPDLEADDFTPVSEMVFAAMCWMP